MGFGSLTGEFWFGLYNCLTSQGQWELRIDLKLTNGTITCLPYNKFAVGPATEQYPLTISGFTGYTTDPFNLRPAKDRTVRYQSLSNIVCGFWVSKHIVAVDNYMHS